MAVDDKQWIEQLRNIDISPDIKRSVIENEPIAVVTYRAPPPVHPDKLRRASATASAFNRVPLG